MNWGNAAVGKINSILHGLEADIKGDASTITDPPLLVDLASMRGGAPETGRLNDAWASPDGQPDCLARMTRARLSTVARCSAARSEPVSNVMSNAASHAMISSR